MAIFDPTGDLLRDLSSLAAFLRSFPQVLLGRFFASNSACRSILAYAFCPSFSLGTCSLSTRRVAASSFSNSFYIFFAATLALQSAVCSFLVSV